jgi:3-oxoacyl-[acyl-carrier-protein] synthase III
MPESLTATAAAPALAKPVVGRGAAIASLGVAVPATVVPNAEIAERLGIDEDWIVQRTGIRERRVAAPGERLYELAALAAQRALGSAGRAAADVDLVLLATTSNDQLMPGASPRVAAAIGAERAGAIDVNAACTGFVSALALGCGQIEAGRAAEVLVVGADLMSALTDPEDRGTAAVFADGAGAVLLRAAEESRVGPILLGADGANADLIYAPKETGKTVMQGHETFRHAVERMSQVTVEAVAAAGLSLDDVDVFAYHQANGRILRAVGERLELRAERVVDCIERFGNTSAASIPLALEQARLAGDLRPGARVLVGAFGAGLTWGAAVIEWGAA